MKCHVCEKEMRYPPPPICVECGKISINEYKKIIEDLQTENQMLQKQIEHFEIAIVRVRGYE